MSAGDILRKLKAAGVDDVPGEILEDGTFVPASGVTAEQIAAVQAAIEAPYDDTQDRITQVDAVRDQRLTAGHVDATTGKTWQCRPDDITKWTAIASSAGLNVLRGAPFNATTYDLISADNSVVTLSAADASALLEGRVMPWVSATILYARQLKDQIQAGAVVDVNAGWP